MTNSAERKPAAGTPRRTLAALAVAVGLAAALLTAGCATSSQPDRAVFFVEPKDGAMVAQEFKVVFGTRGWQVRPLGDMTEGTGHHHLLINPPAAVEKGKLVPLDQPERVLHFGRGQTETMLKLAPGRYVLQLQLGDGAHNSLGEGARANISVEVR